VPPDRRVRWHAVQPNSGVASHPRSNAQGRHSNASRSNMPKSPPWSDAEWTPQRADPAGPNRPGRTPRGVISHILERRVHPAAMATVLAWASCALVKPMAKNVWRFGLPPRPEPSAVPRLQEPRIDPCRQGLKALPLLNRTCPLLPDDHAKPAPARLRTTDPKETPPCYLIQPLDKLQTLRLHGMLKALHEQSKAPGHANSLSSRTPRPSGRAAN